MRIATYNVEWFNNLFDDAGRLILDHTWSGRQDIRRDEQIAALATVFTALDADAVMVIEAPDENSRRHSVTALEAFAAHAGLRARRALIGFKNDTQQEIALLYDPDTLEARHDPRGAGPLGFAGGDEDAGDPVPRFDGSFRIDLDVDAREDVVTFSKPPLEVAARARASGRRFRMIGTHLKSKAPHGARNADEIMRLSIANRRKQLAQAIWLRRRIEVDLAAQEPLILLGDLNDGPGLDEYEDLFGRSSVEIVMGPEGPMHLHDPHARQALSQRLGAVPSSARFFIAPQGHFLQALLDYVMISPDLAARHPRWRIWHPTDDPACMNAPELRDSLLIASDHFPVTLDIDL